MKFHIISELEEVEEQCADALLKFNYEILNHIGLDLKNCFPTPLQFKNVSIENKIALRELLNKFQLKIIDCRDGSQQIFSKEEIIAHWKKPIISWIGADRLYAKIDFESWAVFENDKNPS